MPKFLINVVTSGVKAASSGIKKLSGALMSLTKVAMVSAAGGALALGVAMKKATDASGKFEKVSVAFNNLTKASGFSEKAFSKYTKAVDGTVNSIELMELANSAMLLGIVDSEDKMARLFDQAQRLASAVGKDARFGVESLVTGLGRQSKLMLDNLGIMVDTDKAYENYAGSIGKTVAQLTEQERKTAFTNEALRQADELVAKLGKENLTTTDRFLQMKASMLDTSIAIGQAVTPAVNSVMDSLGKASIRLKDIVVEFGKIDFKQTFDNIFKDLSGLGTAILESYKAMWGLFPEIFRAAFNKILPIAKKILGGLIKGIANMGSFIFEPIVMAGKMMGVKIGNFFIEAINKIKELYNSMAEFIGLTPLDLTPRISEEGLSLANTRMGEFMTEMGDNQIETTGDLTSRLAAIWDEYGNRVIVKNEEVDASNKATTAGVVSGEGKKVVATKKTTKVTLDSAIAAGLASQTALGAIRQVIKAKFSEAIAGLLAKELTTKGFLGVLLGAGFAGAASQLFESVVPTFAQGGDFITSGPQLMMAGEAGPERVQITPLSGGAGGVGNGSSNITLNISAPLVDDTVVESIIPAIREAIRRGEDIGIS